MRRRQLKMQALMLVVILQLFGVRLVGAEAWTRKSDFPSTGMRFAVSFSIATKGYLGVTKTQEFWEYDPSTNVWAQLGNMPGVNFQSPSFVLGDRAFVISGNEVWEYVPGADEWFQKNDVPGEDKRAAFAMSIAGKGYIGGGFFNGINFWEYDPATDSWIQKNDMPMAADNIHGVTFTLDGRGYLEGTNLGHWEYEPDLDSWSQRADVSATFGRALLIEGMGFVYNTFGDVYEYAPAEDQWTQRSSSPGTPVCRAGGFTIAGKGYVGVGGEFRDNTCTLDIINELWEYAPVIFRDGFESGDTSRWSN